MKGSKEWANIVPGIMWLKSYFSRSYKSSPLKNKWIFYFGEKKHCSELTSSKVNLIYLIAIKYDNYSQLFVSESHK